METRYIASLQIVVDVSCGGFFYIEIIEKGRMDRKILLGIIFI